MEGRPTSVSETVALPLQPTTGVISRIPLGGDGFTAPIAAYAVQQFQVTGDAGGGSAGLILSLDERFCSLVSYVTVSINQGTPADADFRLNIGASSSPNPQAPQNLQGAMVATAATLGTTTVSTTWNPTPMIYPGAGSGPFVQALFENVLADVYRMHAYIYLFNVRVRETTPMGPLLWARGAT